MVKKEKIVNQRVRISDLENTQSQQQDENATHRGQCDEIDNQKCSEDDLQIHSHKMYSYGDGGASSTLNHDSIRANMLNDMREDLNSMHTVQSEIDKGPGTAGHRPQMTKRRISIYN